MVTVLKLKWPLGTATNVIDLPRNMGLPSWMQNARSHNNTIDDSSSCEYSESEPSELSDHDGYAARINAL